MARATPILCESSKTFMAIELQTKKDVWVGNSRIVDGMDVKSLSD